MTDYTAPYGTAWSDNTINNREAWKAFDNDNSTYWHTQQGGTSFSAEHLGFNFTTPILRNIGGLSLLTEYDGKVLNIGVSVPILRSTYINFCITFNFLKSLHERIQSWQSSSIVPGES